jgi:hypothetical protein
MIVELKEISKEEVVACFKVFSRPTPEGTKENHDEPVSG